MPTYTQIYYHIVFSTKNRERTINMQHRDELLKYVWGTVQGQNCHLYRVNAVKDHMHLFTHLHPTVCLADFIKTVKVRSHEWMEKHGGFRQFRAWQEAYGAFTHSHGEKDRLIEYVKNQEEHHRTTTFLEEYKRLVEAAGLVFDNRYLP